MKVLVVGLGHVGSAIYELVKGKHEVDYIEIDKQETELEPDVMHICMNYTSDFEDTTVGYMRRFRPGLTILESTVRIGTTRRIYERVRMPIVHSPVVGNEKDGMLWCIKDRYTKYVAAPKPEFSELAKSYYEGLGLRVKVLSRPESTELAKLCETTYYALMISWFQEVDRMCNKVGADFDEVSEFIGRITKESGYQHLRPVFYPGVIGGHCLMPNLKLLKLDFESKFLDAIEESNERRKGELGA